jgi:single-strand DNA-binding protein
MNTITIHGRLTGDPESKQSQNGQAYATFNLADNHGKDAQGKDKATFFHCSAFGKSGELILNSCKKGHQLTVIGRMESSQYTNQQGQSATSLNVTLDRFGFCEPFNAGAQQQSAQPNQQQAPQQGFPPQQNGYGAPPAQQGYQQPPQSYQQPPALPQHSYQQPQQQTQQGYPPQQQTLQQPPQGYQQPQPQQPQQNYAPGWDPNKNVPF